MKKNKSYLIQLLGTTTKLRIIEYLTMEPEPITRYAISRNILAGTGPTYEQIDQLIALGILRETKDKIELDTSFPFYDDIANLVVSTSNYLDDHRILLERINTLFGNDYYITGYIAACQNGPPIDHEQNSALIAVLDLNQNNHWKNYLQALSEVTSIKLAWFDNNTIPKDVKHVRILGSNIWLASVERGIVDCIVNQDCDLYPAILLLLQNMSEENIDGEMLKSIALKNKVQEFFLAVIYEINKIMKKTIIDLDPNEISIARSNLKPKIIDIIKKAYNTLMGG